VTSVFRNWSASELSGFYVFLEKDSTNLRQFFFMVQEKNLLITTYIEKHAKFQLETNFDGLTMTNYLLF